MYSGSGWRRFGLTGKPYGLLQILDFEIQDVLYKIRMYYTKIHPEDIFAVERLAAMTGGRKT
jgi:hypothetical protein